MTFAVVAAIMVLSGLFCANLIDALRASDAETAQTKRGAACASFVGLMFLLCLFIASV